MNNEAIAVKCSLHGPQKSGNVNLPATHAYIPIIAVRGKEVGVFITSQVKVITNARRPVSVKEMPPHIYIKC